MLPVEVGQELELKLGEVGLHDAHAGVGKVDGVDVVVADAAKLVGKKVKVRITAVTEGLAWAELLAPVDAAHEPLTAESEAEKPTRSRRAPAKKGADADAPAEPADADEELEEGEAEAEAEVAEPAEDGAEPPPAKKRTRRGSRGGRNRKKKSATASVVAAPDGEAPADEVVVIAPVIHIPERGLGEAEDGRRRRRRSARAAAPAAVATARSRRRRRRAPAAAIEVAEPELRAGVHAGRSTSRPRTARAARTTTGGTRR